MTLVLFYCVVYCCTICVLLSYITLVAGLLARSQYLEGPATGHLGTGVSWFPCLSKRMLRCFQDSKLLLHAPHVALPT